MMSQATVLVALCGASLTAIISLFGFVITKDLKITEFRQAWINDQRSDLAVVASEACRVARLNPIRRISADLTQFDEAAVRIHLRDNPDLKDGQKKTDWDSVLLQITRVRKELGGAQCDESYVQVLLTPMLHDAQSLLKIEWNRTRNGEPMYKRGFIAAVCLACIVVPLALISFLAVAHGNGYIQIVDHFN